MKKIADIKVLVHVLIWVLIESIGGGQVASSRIARQNMLRANPYLKEYETTTKLSPISLRTKVTV